MKVLVTEKLSPHKYKTPEGYLICVDAVLARTGKQSYMRSELFDTDDETEVDVDRRPEEVFSPQTLASFENKPITVEHPNEDVNSENFKEYAVGFVRDVHQGQVDGQPVILGTLVIQDAKTIEEIENGQHTDLSCGYDCDIDDSENPQQRNIRGNHVALCEQGRAGNARIVDSKKVKDSERYIIYRNSGAGEMIYEGSDLKDVIEEIKSLGRNYYIIDTKDGYKKITYSEAIKMQTNDSTKRSKEIVDSYNGYYDEKEKDNWNNGYAYYFEDDDDYYRALKQVKASGQKILATGVEAGPNGRQYFVLKDSIKDSKYIVHFKHKNGGEDKDIIVEAKGMTEAVEIAKTYVSDFYYKYVNVKPYFEDSVKDSNILANVYNMNGKLLETKKFSSRRELDNYANSLKLYDMTSEKEVYKNKNGDLAMQEVYKIVVSDSVKDDYFGRPGRKFTIGETVKFHEYGFSSWVEATVKAIKGDRLDLRTKYGFNETDVPSEYVEKLNENSKKDSYKDYQSTKESFERIEEMPRTARKWVGETSNKKAGLLAIENGIEDIINSADPSIREELRRRGDKILRDIKIQFRIEDEESTYTEVSKELEKNYDNFVEDDLVDGQSDLSLLKEYFSERQPNKKMELRHKLREMNYKEGVSGVNSRELMWVELNGKKYEVKNLSSVKPLDSVKDSKLTLDQIVNIYKALKKNK